MRTLIFDASEESTERYNLIYEAFAVTERPFRGADLRVCAKVFDKLEALGKYSDNKANRNIYVFEKAGDVILEEVEYQLLKESLQQVSWNSVGARKAAPVIEWFESITEKTTVPKLEK